MSEKLEELRSNWRLVFTGLMGILFGVWALPAFLLGPLTKPLMTEFGWSQASILACMSLLSAGVALASPIVGRLADRFRPGLVATISMLALAACFLLISMLRGPVWEVQLLYFLMGVLGAGSGGIIYTRAIGARFRKARGLALGMVLCGTGLASFLAPLLMDMVDSVAGWRAIGVTVAGLILFVGIPIVYSGLRLIEVDRTAPEQAVGLGNLPGDLTRAETLRDPRFYIMAASISLFGIFNSSLIINIVPALIDRGLTSAEAARIASTLGIAVIVGRLGIGWLLDRWPAPYVGAGMFLLGTAGTLLFTTADGDAAILLAVLGFGLLVGAELDILSFMTMRYFGLTSYGEIYGLLFAIYTTASISGPLLAGLIITGGGYAFLYGGAAVGFAFAGCLLLGLSRLPGTR